jgi:hypothetical protein
MKLLTQQWQSRTWFGLFLALAALLVATGTVTAQVSSDLLRHVSEADLINLHCDRAEAETARLQTLAAAIDEQVTPVVNEAARIGLTLEPPSLRSAVLTVDELVDDICSADDLEESAAALADWQQFAESFREELALIGQDWPAAWATWQRGIASRQTPLIAEQLKEQLAVWQKEINDYAALEAGRATDVMAEELTTNGLRGSEARSFLELRREQLELEVQGRVNAYAAERQQQWHAAARKLFATIDYPEAAAMAALGAKINGLADRVQAAWQLQASGRAEAEQAAATTVYGLALQAVDAELADSLAALSSTDADAVANLAGSLQATRDRFESDLRQATERRDWLRVNTVLGQLNEFWKEQRRDSEQVVFSRERLCQQLTERATVWSDQLAAASEAVDDLMNGCHNSQASVCWSAVTVNGQLSTGQQRLAEMQAALDEMASVCAAGASAGDSGQLEAQLARLLAARSAIVQANELIDWELTLNGAVVETTAADLCRNELTRMDYHRRQTDLSLNQWIGDFQACVAAADGESVFGELPSEADCQHLVRRRTDAQSTVSRMGSSTDRRAELATYCQRPFVDQDGVNLRLVRYWDDFDKWDAKGREILLAYREPTTVAETCDMFAHLMAARTRQIGRSFAILDRHREQYASLRRGCQADSLQAGCDQLSKAEENYAKTEEKLQEFLTAFWGADQLCRRFADRTDLNELSKFTNAARSAGQRAWKMSLSNEYLYGKVDEVMQ